jgi:hypothetical protein
MREFFGVLLYTACMLVFLHIVSQAKESASFYQQNAAPMADTVVITPPEIIPVKGGLIFEDSLPNHHFPVEITNPPARRTAIAQVFTKMPF